MIVTGILFCTLSKLLHSINHSVLDRAYFSLMHSFLVISADIDINHITGSAIALHCCKAHAKINRKMGILTSVKIVTHKNFNLKLCTRDYVGEATHHAKFGFNRYSGGFFPNRRITTLWLFWLSCPFFLGNAPRSNRSTYFHALWLKRRVFA